MYPNATLDHVHYRASDFEATRHFYIDILGAIDQGMVKLGNDYHMQFEIASTTFLFAPVKDGDKSVIVRNSEKLGTYHFALYVDDCAKATAYYKDRGAVFAVENFEISGLRISFLNAPDGMTVELKQELME